MNGSAWTVATLVVLAAAGKLREGSHAKRYGKAWGSEPRLPILRWRVESLDPDGPGKWHTESRHRSSDAADTALDEARSAHPTTAHRIAHDYATTFGLEASA